MNVNMLCSPVLTVGVRLDMVVDLYEGADLPPCVPLLCQFCILTCGLFAGLAVVGSHVPGLVLSYSASESQQFNQ